MNVNDVDLLPSEADSSNDDNATTRAEAPADQIEGVSRDGCIEYLCCKHKRPCRRFVVEMNQFVCDKCSPEADGVSSISIEDLVEKMIPKYLTHDQRLFLIDSLSCSLLEIDDAIQMLKRAKDLDHSGTAAAVTSCKEQSRLLRIYESSCEFATLLRDVDLSLQPRERKPSPPSLAVLKADKAPPNFSMVAKHSLSSFLINELKIELANEWKRKNHVKDGKFMEMISSKPKGPGESCGSEGTKQCKAEESGSEKESDTVSVDQSEGSPNPDLCDFDSDECFVGDDSDFKQNVADLQNAMDTTLDHLKHVSYVAGELLEILKKKRSPHFKGEICSETKEFCRANDIWLLNIEQRKMLAIIRFCNLVRFPAFDGSIVVGSHCTDCEFASFPHSKEIFEGTESSVGNGLNGNSHRVGKLLSKVGPFTDLSMSNTGYLVGYNGTNYTLTIMNLKYSALEKSDDDGEKAKEANHHKRNPNFPSIVISGCNQWLFTAVFNDVLFLAPCYSSKSYRCRISEVWEFAEFYNQNRDKFPRVDNGNAVPFSILLSHHVMSIHHVPEVCSLWVGKDRCPTERTVTYVTSSNGLCVLDVLAMNWEVYEYSTEISRSLLRTRKSKKGKRGKQNKPIFVNELPGTISADVHEKIKAAAQSVDPSMYYLCSPFGVVDTGGEFCRQLVFATAEEEPAVARKTVEQTGESTSKLPRLLEAVGSMNPDNVPVLVTVTSDVEPIEVDMKKSISISTSNAGTSVSMSHSCVSVPEEDELNLLNISRPLIVIPRNMMESTTGITRYKHEKEEKQTNTLESTIAPPFGVTGEPIVYRKGYGGLMPDNPGKATTESWVWVSKDGTVVRKSPKLGESIGVKPSSYTAHVRLWRNVWIVYDALSKGLVYVSIDI